MALHDHPLRSPDDTRRAAAQLAELLQPGDVIGLIGDLGAGKTCFVQGLARALGVPEAVRVTSPTFTIINQYRGGRLPLDHVDLYRIEQDRELHEIGLDDLFRAGGVVAVEWCDRFPVLPADHLEVRLAVTGDETRALDAVGRGARAVELAGAWAARLGST